MAFNNLPDFINNILYESVEESPFFGEGSVGEINIPGAEVSDRDADIDSMNFDFGDEEASETPEEEEKEHETPGKPRDIISELKQKISDLKEEITEKLKPLFPEKDDAELAEALDDATSALDLCDHHLTDLDNALSDKKELEPEVSSEPEEALMNKEPLEDMTMPGGEN